MEFRWHYLALLAFVFTTSATTIYAPGFSDTDAAVHAMDGAFFLDFLAELPPPTQWKTFATNYYARHPAIGVAAYPPLFGVILAIAFAIFGISMELSRFVVFLFGLGSVYLLYELVRRELGTKSAFFAAMLLAANGEFIRWSRETMLEVPSLLFLLAATLFWFSPKIDRRRRNLIIGSIFLAAAVYTKQPAGFLIAAFLLAEFLLTANFSNFFRPPLSTALSLFILILLPLIWLTVNFGHYGTVQLNPASYGASYSDPMYWLQWAFSLGEAVHPLALLIAVVGLKQRRNARYRKLVLLAVSWIAVWYAAFSLLPIKNPRFALHVVPAFCILAGIAFDAFDSFWVRRTAWAATALIAIIGLSQPRPYVDGHRATAAYVAGMNFHQPVLYDGYHNSNFIFHMRVVSPKQIVLRGCKMITSTASGALKTYPIITTDTGIIEMIDQYAVRYIIVEEKPYHTYPHTESLRSLLKTDLFVLEAEIPIKTNLPVYASGNIQVYRYLRAKEKPSTDTIEIFVPSAGMTIEAKIL